MSDSQPPPRSWFQQVPVIVSVLALFVSTASAWRGSQDTVRTKKEELRKLIIDMQELRTQYGKDGLVPGTPEAGLLKAKQGVSLQAAEKLVDDLGERQVTSYEYGLLAIELMDEGDYRKAEGFFQRAAAATGDLNQSAQARRMLAMMYFQPSPLRDPDKGRKIFAETDQLLAKASATDPMIAILRGDNSGAWASSELRAGSQQNAEQKQAEARAFYETLPPDMPVRGQLIAQLDKRVAGGAGQPAVGAPPSTQMSGAEGQVLSAVAQLSLDDVRWLIENPQEEGATLTLIPGRSGRSNPEERERCDRLVRYGLATEISGKELRAIGRTEHGTPDVGVRFTDLYPKVHDFLLTQLSDSLARLKAELLPRP